MTDPQFIERRLRIREVVSQTGLSRAGVYRKEKTDPTFPKHIRDGGISFWVQSKVQTWVRANAEAERARKKLKPYRRGPKIRTALYRHFDADSKLLYVGISLSAVERLRDHRTNATWFDRIVRIEIQWYQSRGSALNAERRAIMREKPECNIAHNGRPRP